ncbi:MAG: M24 family metallopeptidase C-terminal domain-containing protein [Devosia sp.]
MAPIDKRLIDIKLLTDAERQWLDGYHQRVWKEIGPKVTGKVKDWLKDATSAL